MTTEARGSSCPPATQEDHETQNLCGPPSDSLESATDIEKSPRTANNSGDSRASTIDTGDSVYIRSLTSQPDSGVNTPQRSREDKIVSAVAVSQELQNRLGME